MEDKLNKCPVCKSNLGEAEVGTYKCICGYREFVANTNKENIETIIGLLENSLHEEGYRTIRYSESGGKFGTTSYDCLILKDVTGKEYTISIDERMRFNREKGEIEATNDLIIEQDKTMKFFEFSGADFGYYALIGAITEEAAIKYYEEVVGDIEDKDIEPVEITRAKAKIKLLATCKDDEEETKANKEFNKYILGTEPYLILIDGSLL